MFKMIMLRFRKIYKIFGVKYGIKYILIHYLHKHCYIKFIGKQTIKLVYKGHDLYLRMFSRDIDFAESILVGTYMNGSFRGEYDLKGGIGENSNCNTIIDLGANIGLFSVFYAIKFPEKKIIALEPEYKNYCLLKKNVKTFQNVTCINKAIWYHKSLLEICEGRTKVWPSNTPSEGGFYVKENSNNKEKGIEAITIEDIMKKFDIKDCLVKMDIEGSEYHIFKNGSLKWLEFCCILIIETHERFFPDIKLDKEIDSILQNSHLLREISGENKVYISRKNIIFEAIKGLNYKLESS